MSRHEVCIIETCNFYNKVFGKGNWAAGSKEASVSHFKDVFMFTNNLCMRLFRRVVRRLHPLHNDFYARVQLANGFRYFAVKTDWEWLIREVSDFIDVFDICYSEVLAEARSWCGWAPEPEPFLPQQQLRKNWLRNAISPEYHIHFQQPFRFRIVSDHGIVHCLQRHPARPGTQSLQHHYH
jgi:hypothetical protein